MATGIEELYEQDFYVWTQRQAEALRRLAETRPNVELDFPHLIEEVADLGTSQRDVVRSQVRRIIEHCLKLEYSRAVDPRGGWYDSIIDARTRLDDKLSPSLRRDLDEQLPRLWTQTQKNCETNPITYGKNNRLPIRWSEVPASDGCRRLPARAARPHWNLGVSVSGHRNHLSAPER